jgi:hypothetical protein
MNKLSQECINEINKEVNSKWDGYPHYKKLEVKDSMIQALTNPTIYQSAGLMSVEDMTLLIEWATKNGWNLWANARWTKRGYTTEITTTELLNIFRQQNQEK